MNSLTLILDDVERSRLDLTLLIKNLILTTLNQKVSKMNLLLPALVMSLIMISTDGAYGQTVITRSVSTENDDGNEIGQGGTYPGDVYLHSSILKFVLDNGIAIGTQVVGMPFTNVSVPNGTTISDAIPSYVANDAELGNPSNSSAVTLNIRSEDVNKAAAFENMINYISSWITTSSNIWTPSPLTIGTSHDPDDVIRIVQEVLNTMGGVWEQSDSIVLFMRSKFNSYIYIYKS